MWSGETTWSGGLPKTGRLLVKDHPTLSGINPSEFVWFDSDAADRNLCYANGSPDIVLRANQDPRRRRRGNPMLLSGLGFGQGDIVGFDPSRLSFAQWRTPKAVLTFTSAPEGTGLIKCMVMARAVGTDTALLGDFDRVVGNDRGPVMWVHDYE
jgi:hypothetical protein